MASEKLKNYYIMHSETRNLHCSLTVYYTLSLRRGFNTTSYFSVFSTMLLVKRN